MIRATVRTFVVAFIAVATSVAALPPVGAAHSADVDVVDDDFVSEPAPLDTIYIRPMTEVTWTHMGNNSHTVTSDAGSGETFDSGTITNEDTFNHTFPSVGMFDYHCNFHGGMTGTVIVTDDDPVISSSNRSVLEGDTGTTTLNFTVSLSFDSDEVVTVDYATSDGTATAGEDYEATADELTFAAGQVSRTVSVTVNGDTLDEGDETFSLTLSDPQNATLAGGGAELVLTGTIIDDDGPDPPSGEAPTADAGGPYGVDEGSSLTLDATASTDPDGVIESYEWDLDGDGSVDALGPTVERSFPDDGVFGVSVTVVDDDGLSSTDETTVTVTDGASLSRAAGDDRILTAVASARRGWLAAEHALLATGFAFPDALAATALAAELDAPLLLTRPDALPAEVLDALRDLGVDTVWILGGMAAVSQDVQDELVANGFTVRRLQGADRFETARAVALEVGASATDEVVVALGQHADVTRDSWPDALSAGSLSAGPDRLPTLLTRSGSLPSVTEQTLGDLGARKVWLLGGSAAISGDVEARLNALGYQVERLEGPSRYGTSVAVAAEAMDRLPDGDVPLVFATGGNFPDGLTAGAYAARIGGLVVLVHPTDLAGGASAVAEFVATNASRFDVGTVIGGTAAVAAEVARELVEAMTA